MPPGAQRQHRRSAQGQAAGATQRFFHGVDVQLGCDTPPYDMCEMGVGALSVG